jgi:hypothetical protein
MKHRVLILLAGAALGVLLIWFDMWAFWLYFFALVLWTFWRVLTAIAPPNI